MILCSVYFLLFITLTSSTESEQNPIKDFISSYQSMPLGQRRPSPSKSSSSPMTSSRSSVISSSSFQELSGNFALRNRRWNWSFTSADCVFHHCCFRALSWTVCSVALRICTTFSAGMALSRHCRIAHQSNIDIASV